MLGSLSRPFSKRRLLWLSLALLTVNTVYCLLYTRLSGRAESLPQALAWSVANLLPWLFAFEMGKRWQRPIAAVIAGMLLSLFLGVLLLRAEPDTFEMARRLPGAVIVLGLLLALRRNQIRIDGTAIDLPLPPDQIAWVAAAGNYVELHGGPRPLLLRASLGALEVALGPHGFVRIHRSTLVNRRRVERVRRGDLVLDDGRSLKVGARFRAALRA